MIFLLLGSRMGVVGNRQAREESDTSASLKNFRRRTDAFFIRRSSSIFSSSLSLSSSEESVVVAFMQTLFLKAELLQA